MRLALLAATLVGASTSALLATVPVLGTRSRAWRLAPHVGQVGRPTAHGVPGDVPAALAAVADTVSRWGERAVGLVDPLGVRLERVHDLDDVTTFRFRQGVLLLSATVLSAAIVIAVTPPPILAMVLLVGLPLGAAAGPELALAARSRHWSADVRSELPVVGEQLVALLRAGRSPVVALEGIAAADGTPLRRDIARVVATVHRGGGLDAALGTWAATADIDAVHRLVSVLTLHHRTPDLADLVRGEVDAARAELHRDLLAQIDRRAQQVWIPVTVAALVPGAIFLLIPFFDALRLFGATS